MYDHKEFTDFLSDFAKFRVRPSPVNMSELEYVIDTPHDDLICVVLPRIGIDTYEYINENPRIILTERDYVGYGDGHREVTIVEIDDWQKNFRSEIISTVKNWRDYVL